MSAVELDSLPAKRGNVSGGARDGGVSSGREGWPALYHVSEPGPVDDVLILNASDDFDVPATGKPPPT